MGFFDDPDMMDMFAESMGDIKTSSGYQSTVDCTLSYPVGSAVMYDPDHKAFNIVRYGQSMDQFSNRNIAVGVILEQMEDYSYIVLYKNFLTDKVRFTAEQLRSIMENGNDNIGSLAVAEFNVLSRNLNK